MQNAQFDHLIRSALPGRLRLRLPGLNALEPELLDFVKSHIEAQHDCVCCTINPRTGSVLITYDPAQYHLDAQALLAHAQAFLAPSADSQAMPAVQAYEKLPSIAQAGYTILDTLSPYISPNIKSPGRQRRTTQNRLMLATLVASIVTLANSSKWHTVLGVGFLAFLALHLQQHKRVL